MGAPHPPSVNYRAAADWAILPLKSHNTVGRSDGSPADLSAPTTLTDFTQLLWAAVCFTVFCFVCLCMFICSEVKLE